MNRPLTARSRRTTVALIAAGLLTLGACSSKTSDSGDSVASDDVKVGNGVTDDTITLGVMADLSGPFAANDTKITNAEQLYFEQVNADGGICGRDVEVKVVDHGYDGQKATVGYSKLSTEVAGMLQVFGAAMNAALLPKYAEDDLLVWPASADRALLSSKNILGSGATYDLEIINLLEYWLDNDIIKPGDTITHLAIVGGYADSSFAGSSYVAKLRDLDVKQVTLQPTDHDLTAQVAAAKAAGSTALLVSGSAAQVSAVAVAAEGSGLDVPIGINGAGWSIDNLKGTSKASVEKNVWVSQGWASPSDPIDVVTDFVTAYQAKFPDEPIDGNVMIGLVSGTVYDRVLKAACENKDLTPAGLLTARSGLDAVDSGGVVPPLDYTKAGKPSASATAVYRPDASVVGSLEAVTDGFFTSEAAKSYQEEN